MRTCLCAVISSALIAGTAFADFTAEDRAMVDAIRDYLWEVQQGILMHIDDRVETIELQDADYYADMLNQIDLLIAYLDFFDYMLEGEGNVPSYDFQVWFNAVNKLLGGNAINYTSNLGWTWVGTNTTTILENLRQINAKMANIPQIPEGAYNYTNFFKSFNDVVREYGGAQNEFSEEKMWLGFGQMMWDYYDADLNTAVNTNAMSTDDWIELNWYERISTALYRMVMGLPGDLADTDGIDTHQQMQDQMTLAKNSAESTINYGVLPFQQTVQNLTSGFHSLEGMEQPVQKLTLIPEFEWKYGGAETAVLTIPEMAIKPADSELLTRISTATRTIFQWLWRFVFFIGASGFIFATGSGTLYFLTWLFACASELKIKPFEWDKVFVNPFAILDFGGGGGKE